MRKEKIRKKNQGFTLIEILIVLALIGLMFTLIAFNSEAIFGGGQKKIAKMFVNNSISVPLMAYRSSVGSYPSTEEGLKALLRSPQGKEGRWSGPYLKGNDVLLDPWGNEYEYRYPGVHNPNGYDIWSRGPGGQSGDGDDIGNWEPRKVADSVY